MNRWLVIENGVVTNVIAWDGGAWTPPTGTEVVPVPDVQPDAGIGWTYDPGTGRFTAPPVPESD